MQKPSEIQTLLSFFEKEGKRFAEAQRETGMHCPPGCGACCINPAVEVSPLEMLPMAYALLEQGKAESLLDQLNNHPTFACPVYESQTDNPKKGRCTQYETRPLLCRLFGVSARRDKYDELEMMLCRELKNLYPELAQDSQGQLPKLPLVTESYQALMELDSRHLLDRQRISLALSIALEKVLYLSQLVDGQRTENT